MRRLPNLILAAAGSNYRYRRDRKALGRLWGMFRCTHVDTEKLQPRRRCDSCKAKGVPVDSEPGRKRRARVQVNAG